MPLFDHFSFIAPVYDRAIPLKNAERLIRIAGLPVSGALLDAGGGTGRVAQFLAPLAGQVIVADVSLGMLCQARQKDSLLLVCAESERIPFPCGFFERVVMVDALHHVIDQERSASEMLRVLKPGGRLIIEEPDYRRTPVKFIALLEKLALMRSRFLTPEKIARLFASRQTRVEILQEEYSAWIVVDK